MLTLVHAPRSRSSRFLWLLEEIGEPYDIQYVSIRPRRWVWRARSHQSASSRQSPVPEGRRIDGFRADSHCALPGGQIPSGASRADNRRSRARVVSYRACLLFRRARAGIYVEVHESLCATRDSRLGRFRRGDDVCQRAHRSTTLYRGRDVHRGGRALCGAFALFMDSPLLGEKKTKALEDYVACCLSRPARARAAAKDQNPV